LTPISRHQKSSYIEMPVYFSVDTMHISTEFQIYHTILY